MQSHVYAIQFNSIGDQITDDWIFNCFAQPLNCLSSINLPFEVMKDIEKPNQAEMLLSSCFVMLTFWKTIYSVNFPISTYGQKHEIL